MKNGENGTPCASVKNSWPMAHAPVMGRYHSYRCIREGRFTFHDPWPNTASVTSISREPWPMHRAKCDQWSEFLSIYLRPTSVTSIGWEAVTDAWPNLDPRSCVSWPRQKILDQTSVTIRDQCLRPVEHIFSTHHRPEMHLDKPFLNLWRCSLSSTQVRAMVEFYSTHRPIQVKSAMTHGREKVDQPLDPGSGCSRTSPDFLKPRPIFSRPSDPAYHLAIHKTSTHDPTDPPMDPSKYVFLFLSLIFIQNQFLN